MNAAGRNQPRRIILGATCFADADSAIAIAVDLAREIDGEIKALLIEEEAISHFSSLPFARTVSVSGEPSEEVTPELMRKAFDRDARVFRQTLGSAAKRATLEWSFEERKGEFKSILEQDAVEGDFVLVGYQSLGRSSSNEVLLVEDVTSADNDLVKLASQIANAMSSSLSAAILSHDKANARSRASELRGLLANAGIHVASILASNNKSATLDYIQNNKLTAVVTSEITAKALGLDALLSAGRCPVLLAIK